MPDFDHPVLRWFHDALGEPFDFQLEAWGANREGASGLVNAATGMGKTLAVWLGPVMQGWDEREASAGRDTKESERLRVLWVTPLRALATDTARALQVPVEALGLPWDVQLRTGDTSQSIKKKQAQRLPTCLVTTPESLSLLLSYADARERFHGLRCVVCDEWHELLSTKRGTQTELALARLRRWNPGLQTWGLSATLGNLEEAMRALVGVGVGVDASRRGFTPDAAEPPRFIPKPRLIRGRDEKRIVVETLLPQDAERFPWAGHLGLNLLQPVLARLDAPGTSLLFTNTRSQAEMWFAAITKAKPDWLGQVALHHGSIDRIVRNEVEQLLRDGKLRCVVCTSSLDLGVDFSPVERVFQVGSPKGVARLMQRAGRSGHQPGAVSRVIGVPAHAFELVEFAAARHAANARRIESRHPLNKPLDVLVQHLVSVAAGGGFVAKDMFDEVRTAWSYQDLSEQEWQWCLDFVTRGGPALKAYPEYAKVRPADDAASDGGISVPPMIGPRPMPPREEVASRPTGGTPVPPREGGTPVPPHVVFVIASPRTARQHRMQIGTISSSAAVLVKLQRGRTLGTVEESFIGRLRPGDRFVFAGRLLELIRVQGMTAEVRPATGSRSHVPTWQGGKSPLSSQLADSVRERLDAALAGDFADPEMLAIRPLLDLQARWSRIPPSGELLIEMLRSRHGHHAFVYPFQGRLVHEGLGALVAYRLSQQEPRSISVTMNDYGFELLCDTPMDLGVEDWRKALSREQLVEDLLACLNETELARRQFRDIARVAGLIFQGYPGQNKSSRQLQASSELFYEVLTEFDPGNLLIDQARREVLEQQLEVNRLLVALERLAAQRIVIERPDRLTPLSFPLWAEHLREQHVSSESWQTRVMRMAVRLEDAATGSDDGGAWDAGDEAYEPKPERAAKRRKGRGVRPMYAR